MGTSNDTAGPIKRKKARKVAKNRSLRNHLVTYNNTGATNHRIIEKIRLELFFGFHLDQPPAQMRASFKSRSGCLPKQLNKNRQTSKFMGTTTLTDHHKLEGVI